ncbi:glutamate-cysteine ligase family protein [Haloarchaeobius sp. TZWWS8]|uniref:glutamate-cysteine ligase family protein n=1 Tax=Haloarchaeobius sp. TZWWS8 TaxID=3446121 RepID=UPI003EBFC6F4
MKIGLEMELWVVDEQGRLCDGHGLTEQHDRFEPEFVGPLVEVRTEPHTTTASLREDFQRTLQLAIDIADEAGKHLVPLGTPLSAAEAPAKGTRGELFETIYGDGVRSAKNCAGTHFHFEKDEVCRQLNVLTALDPALALLSSSPYYCGDLDCRSSRARAYRRKCGPEFERFCDLWPYVDTVDEWTERVHDAYVAFEELASQRDVSPERLGEHFSPNDTVLNPVRLRHEQPTVEWRAPDSALPSEVLALARDTRRLVEQTSWKSVERGETGVTADRIGIPEFENLASLSDEAIVRGLDSDRVRSYLEGLGFDPDEYDPVAESMRTPEPLTEADARDIRLTQAERLRKDVATLTNGPDVDSAAALSEVSR